MPELGGIEVRLRVDRRPLSEYDIRCSGNSSADCYIVSEEGKNFEVYIKNMLSTTPLACHICIDGHRVRRIFCYAGRSQKTGGAHTEIGRRAFGFSKLEVTDDESLADTLSNDWESLGTIEIRVIRCTSYRKTHTYQFGHNIALPSGPVHELSKKAGTHRVSLGPVKPYNDGPRRAICARPLDTVENPYATFRFRYRPAEVLRAQGIITVSPAPFRAAVQNRHSDNLSPQARVQDSEDHKPIIVRDEDMDDVSDIEEQIKRLQAKLAKRQTAHSVSRVKREASPIRLPQAGKGERIVIDLTDDL